MLHAVIASGAKQSIAETKVRMDCFVASLLAMTSGRGAAFPRRDAPEFVPETSAPKMRAWGMPDARCTRSLACEIKKHTSKSPRSHRDHPAFPAQWF